MPGPLTACLAAIVALAAPSSPLRTEPPAPVVAVVDVEPSPSPPAAATSDAAAPTEVTEQPEKSVDGSDEQPSTDSDSGEDDDVPPDDSTADPPAPGRRFMIGLEGLVIQAPPIRPSVVRFDPRFLGRSISMGGLGIVARYRMHGRISLEATVRSGSVRYAGRDSEQDDAVSHDQVMAEAGVLLFVARGEIARLAFDAGVGGMGSRIHYELDREGTQTFGSALFRVGADAEFLVKRIAFLVSVRTYGVLTATSRVRNRGALFAERARLAPVAPRQTLLVAAAGVAYRF